MLAIQRKNSKSTLHSPKKREANKDIGVHLSQHTPARNYGQGQTPTIATEHVDPEGATPPPGSNLGFNTKLEARLAQSRGMERPISDVIHGALAVPAAESSRDVTEALTPAHDGSDKLNFDGIGSPGSASAAANVRSRVSDAENLNFRVGLPPIRRGGSNSRLKPDKNKL